MAYRSLQEINRLREFDYRFFKNSVKDYSGNSNDLTVLSVGMGSDEYLFRFGKCMGFSCLTVDGNYLNYEASMFAALDSFSFEAFYVPRLTEASYVFYPFIDSDGRYLSIQVQDVVKACFDSVGSGEASAADNWDYYKDGQPCHIVFTRDINGGVLSNQFIYINGTPVSFSVGTSGIESLDESFSLFNSFLGSIFYVKMYNEYLSSDECNMLYQNCRSTFSNIEFQPAFSGYFDSSLIS
jgi:hypothetical protein